MYPHERALVKHLSGKPFALIGVNSDQETSIVSDLVSKGQVTWRSFQNQQDGKKISDEWGIRGWPTIFLIDAGGRIRYADHGKDLDKNIAALLEEMGEQFPHDEIEATAAEEEKRTF